MEVTAHRGKGKLTLPQPLGHLFVTETERRRNKGGPLSLCPSSSCPGTPGPPSWDSSALASRQSEGHRALPAWWEQKPHPFGGGEKGKKSGKKSQAVKRRLRDFLPFLCHGAESSRCGAGTEGWHRQRGPRAGKSLLGTFPWEQHPSRSTAQPGGLSGPLTASCAAIS